MPIPARPRATASVCLRRGTPSRLTMIKARNPTKPGEGGHIMMTEAPQRPAPRPTTHRISRRRALVASSVGLAAAGAGPLLPRTDAAMARQATPVPEAASGTVTAAPGALAGGPGSNPRAGDPDPAGGPGRGG